MVINSKTPCPQCGSAKTMAVPDSLTFLCYACKHEFTPEKVITPLRIFLSYGHDANEELVRRIKADLEQRGHDVWFDKNDIKFGDDWRREITDGITGSHRVLSFLSKHSTRDPGVCLDEIAIAIGVKGGNIQTILVESENEVKPPASISHIQWLDMHDWKERMESGSGTPPEQPDPWETWYQSKLAEIIRVVESDESRRFAGEIETLSGHLKPIASDSRISTLLRKGFIGRQWLFDAIETWRNPGTADPQIGPSESRHLTPDSRPLTPASPPSRLFWITGDPGVGKSAFAAHLTHFGRDKVIAAQFVEWDKPDHRDARRVVRSLAFQLATRLPDYRKLLLTLPEIADLDRKDPAELFDYLLANPLKTVIGGGRERLLIVIDALDEAGEAGRNPLVEMLARHATRLPDWLGLVVTSRPESHVELPLQSERPVLIDRTSDKNIADLREYILHGLAHQLSERPDAAHIVKQILEKSEGVWLYAELFCDDVQSGHLSLDRPEQFPQGLGGIYFQFFRRKFPRRRDGDDLGFDISDFEESCRPVLEIMIAAQEPIRLKNISRMLKWDKYTQNKALDSFGALLNTDDERIRPFHRSLVDWLGDARKSGPYFVDIDVGHKRLAARCWEEFSLLSTERVSWYARLHFQMHLDRVGESDKKHAIQEMLRAKVKSVRVYVSSTFRDLYVERETLVKFVFPQLRDLCESRGIAWADVDLRWGVVAEETPEADGCALAVTLEEIDRCRPFFVGILADRYGWIPDRLPSSLLSRYPWIAEQPNSSVTELEIRHGVLNYTSMFGYGLVYFRSPQFVEQLPAAIRSDFKNESPSSLAKMSHLKELIREAADEEMCLLREGYQSPEEFGRWICDDFTRLLNTFLPETQETDPLTAEATAHERFAQTRARNHPIRRQYFDTLDLHVSTKGPPLVISGGPGAGVSALLSRWYLPYREQHPNDFVLAHFFGATAESNSVSELLRRLMLELKRSFLLPGEVPNQPGDAIAAFPIWLSAAAARGRIVILLDGLNSLDEENSSLDWLPQTLPSSVRLIVSTSSGRCLDTARSRGWHELNVQQLAEEERKEFVTTVLSQYGKRLSSAQVARIVAAQQTRNVLFLQLFLDELRMFGHMEGLDEWIEHYLKASNLTELYELIIARLEQDYGLPLVQTTLVLIWASRKGLAEDELLDLLGSSDEQLPRAKFLPFYRASKMILCERIGLLNFVHREAQAAVFSRYCSTPETKRSAHQRLEEYFDRKQICTRVFDELTWQQEQLWMNYSAEFPKYLADKFQQFFQSKFPDLEQYRETVRPVLSVILAASHPLPITVLQRLFNWQEQDVRDFISTFEHIIQVVNETDARTISPYHGSLFAWLSDETKAGPYLVDIEEGRRMLSSLFKPD